MFFIIVTNNEAFFVKAYDCYYHFWFIGGSQDMLRWGGLVVERRTPEPEVGGSILTRVAVLYP